MTNAMKIVGGGDVEPNLEKLGLKPYNSEEAVIPTANLEVIPVVIASASLIVTIANGVMAWLGTIGRDEEKREAFTRTFVEEAVKRYPDYNVVIIHTNHDVIGNYIHQHVELQMAVGTCGYEIYFSLHGDEFKLTNNGDGGYLNWAYNGYFRREDNPYANITAVWG